MATGAALACLQMRIWRKMAAKNLLGERTYLRMNNAPGISQPLEQQMLETMVRCWRSFVRADLFIVINS